MCTLKKAMLFGVAGAAALAAGACGLIPSSVGVLPSAGSTAPALGATWTPTPFGPQAPTPTPAVTPTPAPTPTPTPDPSKPWGDFAGPTEPSAIEIQPPASQISFDSSVVNILVMGSDARPNEISGRSDVFMIVSLDPAQGTVTLLSIPRDLYVYVPGRREDRINTAVVFGGPDLAIQTVLYNFGIPIQHWITVNFSGFTTIVDQLGGIDVQSTGNLYDECGHRWWRYTAGHTYHMDGFTALCYVRMRETSSDFDRLRREQEVIQAIFTKTLSVHGLTQIPALFSQFTTYVHSDITVQEALPLVPLAAKISSDPTQIRRFAIDQSMAPGWRVPYSGASVLLPDWTKIEDLLNRAFPNAP